MALLITLFTVHFAIGLYFAVKLINSHLITAKQKRLNILLLFIIPFLWAVLVYYLLKKQPGSHEVAVKNDISSNGYHESGIAIINH